MAKKKKDKKDKKAREREPVAGPSSTEAARTGTTEAAGKKTMISFRVDPDVLEHFKASGPGYQTRMHAVLRDHVNKRRS